MKKNPVILLTLISLLMIGAILSFAIPNHNAVVPDPELRNIVHTESELEIIRKRVISELMAPKTEQSYIEGLLGTIRDDGSWPDIDYEDVSRTGWEHRFHLEHIGDLSRAYKQPESTYFQNSEVKDAIFSAMRFWFRHNFKCDNWYYNVVFTGRHLRIGLLVFLVGLLILQKQIRLKSEKTFE